jgi:hypothetical protein
MSRHKPHITEIVAAKLTGENSHEVSVILHIREVWGKGAEREDFVIEIDQLNPTSHSGVGSGHYLLDYRYGGKHIRKPVEVANGRFKVA